MNPNDLVVLVPGLFGFNTLGEGPFQIAYFDDVRGVLSEATGLAIERIVVCPVPPAESLEVRVAYLYDFVKDRLSENRIAMAEDGCVHLVGHSTGGCDARLLVNSLFKWPHAPSDAERDHLIARVGAVVTLSAPLRGTPIARRLMGELNASIPLLFLLSIIGKAGIELRRPWHFLKTAFSALMPQPESNASAVDKMNALLKDTRLPSPLSSDVLMYLESIIAKHGLINDLTMQACRTLNQRVRDGDRVPLRCYVSVSPAPKLRAVPLGRFQLKLLQAAVYAYAYFNTRPNPRLQERPKFPIGEWLDQNEHTALIHDDASDGVVPAGSQTLNGQAAGIILGDHLDVVGHYSTDGVAAGDTVFRSNAGFDDARFMQLWKAIAIDVRTVSIVK